MDNMVALAVDVCLIGLLVSFSLAFVRLVLGPTHGDRVVALDLIGFITISFIAVFTIGSRQTAFLDIAITLALVLFLGTITFAKFMKSYLVKSQKDKGGPS